MKSHTDIIKEVFGSMLYSELTTLCTNDRNITFNPVPLIISCMDMAVNEANRIPKKDDAETTQASGYMSIVCKHSGKTCGESFNKIPECSGCEWNQELEYYTVTTATWQKCPVCNGEGVANVINYSTTGGNYGGLKECHVCKGTGIINSETGKPPEK